MRTNIYRNRFLAIFALILAASVLMSSMTYAKAQSSEPLKEDIEALLSDYSQYLETGKTSQKANYSPQMDMLIANRREYYTEFYEKGLHSNLTSLESRFVTDQGVTIVQRDDIYHASLVERVTMYGYPITVFPEEYPLIQAAEWSLTQTDNVDVKKELNHYIESMTRGVNESVKEGVEIVFVVRHNIDLKEENGQLQIIKDTFTDKAVDNGEGFDNVIWVNSKFEREKLDWMSMIDYAMYHTPTETMGKILLADYESIADKPVSENSRGSFNYYRWGARWYINYYTSNPNYYYEYCPGSSVLQDTSWYTVNDN